MVALQTFVTESVGGPVKICMTTAHHLDSARLGKQRIECKQIYTALTTGQGWIHHPATKMWEGCLDALMTYGYFICQEWKFRGFDDSLEPYFYERMPDNGLRDEDWPWWFGYVEMVRAHRSKLIHKAPTHYRKLFAHKNTGELTLPAKHRLPYIWPDPVERNGFRLSAAEAKRADWTVPCHWSIDSTRKVVFA